MRKHKPPWLKRFRLAVTGVVMAIAMVVAPAAMADLNGYDVSGYQAPDITQVAPADFAIVKVNQGWYINSSWGQQASGAVNTGKELGLYDYASGMDATTEADNFVNHINGYVGKAMLVLDWEPYQNAAWGNSNWVRTWVYRVHARTGVWPVVYCSKGFVGQIPATSEPSACCGRPSTPTTTRPATRTPHGSPDRRAKACSSTRAPAT